MSPPEVLSLGVSDSLQWRAERMQLVNWGGFNGFVSIPFSPDSTLIAGATGSGKSTVLDAYLALMMDANTPFNGASNDATVGRARSKEQRSLLTYLRGKLDDTTHDGEDTARVLRGAATWTWGAVSVTFIDDIAERFTAIRLYHVPRSATTDSDITKKLCTVDGAIDLHDLEEFAGDRFDKKALERRFAGLRVRGTYTQFATTVQTRLGIGANGDGNNALRLLARIQAGKAMPTVDALFKTMVLEQPATYRHADNAVEHFSHLETAYAEMVTAEKKQRTLDGIVEWWDEREQHAATVETIDALQIDRSENSPFGHWAATTELALLADAVTSNVTEIERATVDCAQLETLSAKQRLVLRDLEAAYRDAGGGAIDDIDRDIETLQEEQEAAVVALGEFVRRTEALGLDLKSEAELVAAQNDANAFITSGHHIANSEINVARDAINQQDLWPHRSRLNELEAERTSLEGRAGRVPVAWHNARVEAAAALGVDPTDLPFVAELIDVAPQHRDWRDAAELALGAVTRILLVDDRRLDDLSIAINDVKWSARLSYQGVELRHATGRALDDDMLSGRLIYSDSSPFIWWVRDRLTSPDIDARCVLTPTDLVGPGRRVTRSGQTRQRRRGAHGRTNAPAIIGFDNTSRLAEIDEEVLELTALTGAATAKIAELDERGMMLSALLGAYTVVQGMRWEAIDPESRRIRIDELLERRQRIVDADDKLAELAKRVDEAAQAFDSRQREVHRALDNLTNLTTMSELLAERTSALRSQMGSLDDRSISHTADQCDLLESALLKVAPDLRYEPDSYARTLALIAGRLREDRAEASKNKGRADTALTKAFQAYQDHWPDPNLGIAPESYPNYLEILEAITGAGLHTKREEWARRVTSWTGDDLVPLNIAIDGAVQEINARLAPVNAILATLPFGARRQRLRIDLRELHHDDHIRFRKNLRNLSSDVLTASTFDAIEQRFDQLSAFIDLIRPGRNAGAHQRDYYLDVRQHIELSAVVLDEYGEIQAKFTSLGGKSGGESQELAAFIVGAALRYQLGDEHRSRPRFAPVLLDEGFVKADSEFAGRSVRAWKGLGFQLIVATAFGTVSALEPHMDDLLQVTKNPSTGRANIHLVTDPSS